MRNGIYLPIGIEFPGTYAEIPSDPKLGWLAHSVGLGCMQLEVD